MTQDYSKPVGWSLCAFTKSPKAVDRSLVDAVLWVVEGSS